MIYSGQKELEDVYKVVANEFKPKIFSLFLNKRFDNYSLSSEDFQAPSVKYARCFIIYERVRYGKKYTEILHTLLSHDVTLKDALISKTENEYLSVLNSILNVMVSVFAMVYYSFTKGYQNISSKDLRFFAFGEKQQIENIDDLIEEKNTASLTGR